MGCWMAVWVDAISFLVWSCSVEFVFVLRVWNDTDNSWSWRYVTMGNHLSIWEHRYVVWWIDWIITTAHTLEYLTFCCHGTQISLWMSCLEGLMLRGENTWLVDKWLLVEWVWIIVLTTWNIFWWNIVKNDQVLVFTRSSTWPICYWGIFLMTSTCTSSSIARVHNTLVHIRHVEFRLFKLILHLLGPVAYFVVWTSLILSCIGLISLVMITFDALLVSLIALIVVAFRI